MNDDTSYVQSLDNKERKKLQQHQKSWVTLAKNKDIVDQIKTGKILACISSRPGQHGKADGYILEGAE